MTYYKNYRIEKVGERYVAFDQECQERFEARSLAEIRRMITARRVAIGRS